MPRMNRTGQFRGYAYIALGGLKDMHTYETLRCIDGASAHLHEVHRSAYLRYSYFLSRPDASIANRQHQQNYFAKSFASHCQIYMSYSVFMEC